MKTIDSLKKEILNLMRELNIKSPHRASEICVELSVLLADLSDLSDDKEIKRFIKARESMIIRVENHLKNLGNFERRGI